MSAYESDGVRVWDRDGLFIVIEILNPYQQPRLVMTKDEARRAYLGLREFFGQEAI